MMKVTIKAVDMTRAIRDKHAELLQGTTPAERIAFYREKARKMRVVAASSEVQPPVMEQKPS